MCERTHACVGEKGREWEAATATAAAGGSYIKYNKYNIYTYLLLSYRERERNALEKMKV